MSGIRSIRFEEDLFKRLGKEKNGTKVVNEALRMYYEAKDRGLRLPTDDEEKELDEPVLVEPKVTSMGRRKGYMHDKFIIPVGDVIKYGIYRTFDDEGRPVYTRGPEPGATHLAESRVWWCPPDKITHVEELAKTFTSSGGFTFRTGVEGGSMPHGPQVIESQEEERKVGGLYTCNTRMVPALTGDRMVWLEIKNADKALDVLDKHSALPCAVVCDVFRYADDDVYRQAFDKANEYFIHYFSTGEPMRTSSTSVTEEERLRERYDL